MFISSHTWYVENVISWLCLVYHHNVVMCTPGVPLTPSNVMGAVEKVKWWWRESGAMWSLTERLFIPKSKEDEIKHNFPDELEQKKQVISYWINTDPLAGWRRLITALDWMEETQLADLIRSNAEPLTGS